MRSNGDIPQKPKRRRSRRLLATGSAPQIIDAGEQSAAAVITDDPRQFDQCPTIRIMQAAHGFGTRRWYLLAASADWAVFARRCASPVSSLRAIEIARFNDAGSDCEFRELRTLLLADPQAGTIAHWSIRRVSPAGEVDDWEVPASDRHWMRPESTDPLFTALHITRRGFGAAMPIDGPPEDVAFLARAAASLGRGLRTLPFAPTLEDQPPGLIFAMRKNLRTLQECRP